MTEIFLQPELEELVIDGDKKAEWEEKIKSLGLEGQIELTGNSPRNSASPYTFMNKQMKLVYETICPAKTTVESYSKSVIPIDVLSHVALCKQEKYFSKLEVWYDDKHPDPILVGYLSSRYDSDLHIIARWGDEIVPFEQLVEKAIRRYTEAYKISLEALKANCNLFISEAELKVKQVFSGQKGDWEIQPRYSSRISSTDLRF
jgi:hypothetical protein